MPYCTNCGASVPEGNKYCSNCGAAVSASESVQPQAPAYQPTPSYNYGSTSSYSQSQRPEPVATGGMIAWSIITLLLCTIPGIVALVKTCNVNKALTYEEQQKTLSSAKTWATVGTVLGVLALIGAIAGRAM